MFDAAVRRIAQRAQRNRTQSAGRDAGGAQCGSGPAVIAWRRSHGDGNRVWTAGGVEAQPLSAVGQAMEIIPRRLCQNCGADTIRVMTKLRVGEREREE